MKFSIVFFSLMMAASISKGQTLTIGRLMELEAKVAEKELLEKLEKNNAPVVGNGVIPLQANVPGINQLPGNKLINPLEVKPSPPAKKQPTTLAVFGVGNDLKADVIVNGHQYQASKGGNIANYVVSDVLANGVVLEQTIVVKRKGKKTTEVKRVFAPLAS